MLWIANISSQRPLALSRREGLAPGCEGSANAPKTKLHLRADRACRFGGRAGLQPCHIHAERSAFQLALSYSEGCAAFLAACIRSLRSGFVPSLRHKRLAPSTPKRLRQVFAFRIPNAASPYRTHFRTTSLGGRGLSPAVKTSPKRHSNALTLSQQVFESRVPRGAAQHLHKLPTYRRHHPVSARHILPIRPTSNLRRISYFRFSNRQFFERSLSAAESARGADASHTLPSQIHCPKGSR